MRSVAHNNEIQQRSVQNTPTPWDSQGPRDQTPTPQQNGYHDNYNRNSRNTSNRDSNSSQRERIERLGITPKQQHTRNESGATGTASSAEYNDSTHGGRRHDYDVHSMETDLGSPRTAHTKNPIPAPIVTVRSEYPTLSRSKEQQSLACLVTIEVPDGKWMPDIEDLSSVPPVPPMPLVEEQYNNPTSQSTAPAAHSRKISYDPPEFLEEVTHELRARVDNWHGLDFSR